MRNILIFACGVVTGAGITFGTLAVMYKKRNKDNDDADMIDEYEEWEKVEPEEKEVDKNIEKQSEEYNEKIKEYAAEHKEPSQIILEPWIMSDEDWEESPYEKAYYTYYAQDNVLVDEHMEIVADGRCGEDYKDICEINGVVHVCNEELETNFEITYYDESSYTEDSINYEEFYE